MIDELKPKNFRAWALVSMIACLVACISDLGAVFVFARYYPGYNSMSQPISALGAMGSPISRFVSLWWILIGIILFIFAFAYEKSEASLSKYHRITSWLIMLYAVFEQAGSGIFPGNRIAGRLTSTGIVHNVLGSVGIIALLVAPLVLSRKYKQPEDTAMYRFLRIITCTGIPLFIIFILSHFTLPGLSWLKALHGFWQRLFLAEYYAFMSIAAIRQYRDNRLPDPETLFNLSQQH